MTDKTEAAKKYFKSGVANAKQGRFEAAIEDFDKVIEIFPRCFEALNNRGYALHELGRYVDAIADYDKALELNPMDCDARYNRGLSKIKRRQYVDGIRDYITAIYFFPRQTEANKMNDKIRYFEAGNRNAADGKYEEAIKYYDKVLQIDPTCCTALYNRAFAKCKLKKYVEAIEAFDKALELNAGDSEILYNREKVKESLMR